MVVNRLHARHLVLLAVHCMLWNHGQFVTAVCSSLQDSVLSVKREATHSPYCWHPRVDHDWVTGYHAAYHTL
jgi:hypothetical protein